MLALELRAAAACCWQQEHGVWGKDTQNVVGRAHSCISTSLLVSPLPRRPSLNGSLGW